MRVISSVAQFRSAFRFLVVQFHLDLHSSLLRSPSIFLGTDVSSLARHLSWSLALATLSTDLYTYIYIYIYVYIYFKKEINLLWLLALARAHYRLALALARLLTLARTLARECLLRV